MPEQVMIDWLRIIVNDQTVRYLGEFVISGFMSALQEKLKEEFKEKLDNISIDLKKELHFQKGETVVNGYLEFILSFREDSLLYIPKERVIKLLGIATNTYVKKTISSLRELAEVLKTKQDIKFSVSPYVPELSSEYLSSNERIMIILGFKVQSDKKGYAEIVNLAEEMIDILGFLEDKYPFIRTYFVSKLEIKNCNVSKLKEFAKLVDLDELRADYLSKTSFVHFRKRGKCEFLIDQPILLKILGKFL